MRGIEGFWEPRSVWRRARLLAKYFDRRYPRWWQDETTIAFLLRPGDNATVKCWKQLIRQRQGW